MQRIRSEKPRLKAERRIFGTEKKKNEKTKTKQKQTKTKLIGRKGILIYLAVQMVIMPYQIGINHILVHRNLV